MVHVQQLMYVFRATQVVDKVTGGSRGFLLVTPFSAELKFLLLLSIALETGTDSE